MIAFVENEARPSLIETKPSPHTTTLSTHFYRDLIWLLTRAGFENGNLFNPLALIYEACAYQINPEAQYPRG